MKTCHIGKSVLSSADEKEYYAITRLFKDGGTSDRYKYKIENWDFVQQQVLKSILEPLGVTPEKWQKFIDREGRIETDTELAYKLAEITQLEKMLVGTPKEDVIDKESLMARIEKVKDSVVG